MALGEEANYLSRAGTEVACLSTVWPHCRGSTDALGRNCLFVGSYVGLVPTQRRPIPSTLIDKTGKLTRSSCGSCCSSRGCSRKSTTPTKADERRANQSRPNQAHKTQTVDEARTDNKPTTDKSRPHPSLLGISLYFR